MFTQIKNLNGKNFQSLSLNLLISFIDFFLVLVLARLLGTFEFGKYIFIVSFIKFLGLPMVIGYPFFVLRKSSYIKSEATKEYNILLNKNIYVLAIFLFFLIVSVFTIKVIYIDFLKGNFKIFFLCLVSIIPALSINNSIAAISRSSGAEIKGQVLENLIPNFFFLILVLGFDSIYKFESFYVCLLLLIGSIFSSLIFTLYQTKDIISLSKIKIYNFKKQIINEIKESSTFILFQIFVLANNLFPIIILGFFQIPETVGNFKLAVQISSITGLCLHAINKIVQPRIAKSYSDSDYDNIQKIALSSNRVVSTFSLSIGIIIFLFYSKFIVLFFGDDFLIPRITFLIILLSPLINSIFGSGAEILLMSGKEKVSLKWATISMLIGVILNFLLAPYFGINGVAISILIATFIKSFIFWKKSFLLLNIKSSFILDKMFRF